MNNNLKNIDPLIELCKLGDPKAQFEIHNQFYDAMYRIAFKIINDKNLAEDILQESFLKAFLCMDQFKNEATFGSWLKKIVTNKSIDLIKQQNKFKYEDIQLILTTLPDESCNEAQENKSFKPLQIIDMIYSLNGRSKIIMILFYIKGYNKKEICKIMNISIQNFHTILFRAKKELKRKIIDENPIKDAKNT